MTKLDKLRNELAELTKQWDVMIAEAQVEYTVELHRENVRLVDEKSVLRKKIEDEVRVPAVGKYANHYMYTDVQPYEIVKVVSDITLEIRPMNAELDSSWKGEFHIGGFSANCSNQNEQSYNYSSNEDAYTIRIRKKKDGSWGNGNMRFSISDKPIKFYDYNF